MAPASTGLSGWTHRFVLTSGVGLLGFFVALSTAEPRVAVLVGVFGFLCPMIFGMGYLLLPPYLGTTLIDSRVAGVHFVLAYSGAGLLVWGRHAGEKGAFELGALAWSLGVAVFLGALAMTAGLAIRDSAGELPGTGDRPQRSTRLATATIPLGLGYLAVGTVGLLSAAGMFEIGWMGLPAVLHLYAVGFGALLVFSLGARLLIGFFHVRAPSVLVWTVLVAGAVSPWLLARYLWIDPWFRLGGALAVIAMLGYLVLVVHVALRTDSYRVGLSGILLGAFAGGAAVGAAVPLALENGDLTNVAIHRRLVLGGFFPLTVVGYAFLFFPVRGGGFLGASARGARATIGLLALGVALQVVGIESDVATLRSAGTAASVAGSAGYVYLLGRRFG